MSFACVSKCQILLMAQQGGLLTNRRAGLGLQVGQRPIRGPPLSLNQHPTDQNIEKENIKTGLFQDIEISYKYYFPAALFLFLLLVLLSPMSLMVVPSHPEEHYQLSAVRWSLSPSTGSVCQPVASRRSLRLMPAVDLDLACLEPSPV